MGSRRTPDSPPPARPAPPTTAPRDAKPATQAPAAAVKKTTKPLTGSARQKQAVVGKTRAAPITPEERRGMIAKAAYLRGQSRGFAPGGETDDWLEAEQEIDALLSGVAGAAQ